MVKKITRKRSSSQAEGFGGGAVTDKGANQTPAETGETPDPTDDEGANQTDIKVVHDETAGTAVVTLEHGFEMTLTEPKTRDFIHYTSLLESAKPEMRTGTMSVFWLTQLMITRWRKPHDLGAGAVDLRDDKVPDFDTFMDSLGDSDVARVGAAFQCFPNVLKRYKAISEGFL